MKVAVYVAQILKIFAQIMANFLALGMRPYPLHPHTVRLWIHSKSVYKISKLTAPRKYCYKPFLAFFTVLVLFCFSLFC